MGLGGGAVTRPGLLSSGPKATRTSFGPYTSLGVGGDLSHAISRETEAVVSWRSHRSAGTGPERAQGWESMEEKVGRAGMPAAPRMRGGRGRPGFLASVCSSLEFP